MSSLRKLKALMLGQTPEPASDDLRAAAIPVSQAECRGCADPCDEGHDEYPRFDVDMETQMLGSVKPYSRQLVISTGKSDWPKEVTEVHGTLAAYLLETRDAAPKQHRSHHNAAKSVPGVYDSATTSKVTILNGSHYTLCDDASRETVLVFPDYKVVTEVPRSLDGATAFWKSGAAPGFEGEDSHLKTWVLPYACVILLCSHKKRDNRCALAAPVLELTLMDALEREGWQVHTQLEDPWLSGPPLEEFKGTAEEKDAEVLRQLKLAAAGNGEKRVLILRNSHVGGHKFAGNVIINTPHGVSVWYGRVTAHEINAIVKETIIGGKILPPLLRGGLNLARPGHTSLNDW
ncbi:Sucrase/ferredoxin-like-domain-containing protein [Sparassis latifolia]